MADIYVTDLARRLGVRTEALAEYQVLCLPENLDDADRTEDLRDAEDAADLAKALKSLGVACGNSLDLGLSPRVMHRRAIGLWLGTVWVLEHVALPLVLGVLANYLTSAIRRRKAQGHPDVAADTGVDLKLRLLRDGELTRLDYHGDPELLRDLLRPLSTPSDPSGDDDAGS